MDSAYFSLSGHIRSLSYFILCLSVLLSGFSRETEQIFIWNWLRWFWRLRSPKIYSWQAGATRKANDVVLSLSLKVWEPGQLMVRAPVWVSVWRQQNYVPSWKQSSREKEFSLLNTFVYLAFNTLGEAHPHRERQSALFSLLIYILNSSKNIFEDIPRE